MRKWGSKVTHMAVNFNGEHLKRMAGHYSPRLESTAGVVVPELCLAIRSCEGGSKQRAKQLFVVLPNGYGSK